MALCMTGLLASAAGELAVENVGAIVQGWTAWTITLHSAGGIIVTYRVVAPLVK